MWSNKFYLDLSCLWRLLWAESTKIITAISHLTIYMMKFVGYVYLKFKREQSQLQSWVKQDESQKLTLLLAVLQAQKTYFISCYCEKSRSNMNIPDRFHARVLFWFDGWESVGKRWSHTYCWVPQKPYGREKRFINVLLLLKYIFPNKQSMLSSKGYSNI